VLLNYHFAIDNLQFASSFIMFWQLMPVPHLILASRSPRRRELLAAAGYQFEVLAPDEDVECGVCSERGPAGLVAELAYRKAAAVRSKLAAQNEEIDEETGRLGDQEKPLEHESPSLPVSLSPSLPTILAADTVAECDGMVLGKPRDEADARAMLRHLSGRLHRVLTGVCVWPLRAAEPLIRVAVTELRMDELSDAAIDDYLATGGWVGKAGAFGYQDRLGWVHVESGSETNVVGLPMELLAEMLAEMQSRE
jgi:septum formation protein